MLKLVRPMLVSRSQRFGLSGMVPRLENSIDCIEASDPVVFETLKKSMIVKEDFLSQDEEKSLLDEIEPYMKKLRYEYDHWDDAIHAYRETERLDWTPQNRVILDRVKKVK